MAARRAGSGGGDTILARPLATVAAALLLCAFVGVADGSDAPRAGQHRAHPVADSPTHDPMKGDSDSVATACSHSGCANGLEQRESQNCGFMRKMCCSRASEAAARWEEGARWAEENGEDACFNRCPKNSRCNPKTKQCVCDIGYVLQGNECFSIKEDAPEELPLPSEVPVPKAAATAGKKKKKGSGDEEGLAAGEVPSKGGRRFGGDYGDGGGQRGGGRAGWIKLAIGLTVVMQICVAVSLAGGRAGIQRIVRKLTTRGEKHDRRQ